MIRGYPTLLAALALSLAASTSLRAASQAAGRVSLVAHAEVRANVVTLSDLLPAGAPGDLRAEAAQIALGSAPEPTSTRRISRAEIENAVLSNPDLLAEITIPDQVAVGRSHRALTTRELEAAIRAALGREPGDDGRALKFGPLALAAPVYVTSDDPGLRVTEIRFDPLRHETRFRLWTSKEPRNLPFYVTLPSDAKFPALVARRDLVASQPVGPADFEVERRAATSGGSATLPLTPADLAGLETRTPLRAGEAVNRSMFTQAVLVEPGMPARLVVKGNGFRLETTVVPLERGVLGQQIRVRDPDTHRILAATVVAKGVLRSEF